MATWQVRLQGDPLDLQFLEQTFVNGPRRVLRDETYGHLYESDSFQAASKAEEVEAIAKAELAILSGILKIDRAARQGLAAGTTYLLHPDGRRDLFVNIHEGVHARAFVGALVASLEDASGNKVVLPAPPPRAKVLLDLATSNDAVAKVLRLLDAPDSVTWSGLYRIYEVVENDAGGLGNKPWCSAAEVARFKRSANSVSASGDQARHGSEQATPPANPMTLPEAEAFWRYVIQAWLADKGA